MDDGFVKVPNAVIDEMGCGEELTAWVWLMRTRDYETGVSQVTVRQLARLMNWNRDKAHKFLRKFNTDKTLTKPGQNTDKTLTNYQPPEPTAGQSPDAITDKTLTEPRQNTDTYQETRDKKKNYKTTTTTTFRLPDSISPESWDAWMAIRAKKGGADSDHAKMLLLKRLERDAPALGWTLQQCVDEAVERKWIGFKAEWILKDRQQGQPQKSFREIDNDAAAKDVRERNERLQRLRAAAQAERNGASPDVVQAIADGRAGTSLPTPPTEEPDVPF